MFGLPVTSQHWDGANGGDPSSWKTRTHLSYMINTMTAYDLATHGPGQQPPWYFSGLFQFWHWMGQHLHFYTNLYLTYSLMGHTTSNSCMVSKLYFDTSFICLTSKVICVTSNIFPHISVSVHSKPSGYVCSGLPCIVRGPDWPDGSRSTPTYHPPGGCLLSCQSTT